MKFTEEQFNTLVKVQEDQYPKDLSFAPKEYADAIGYTVLRTDCDLQLFISRNDLGNEAVALMNPLTREWAHEQFVEKEKRYVWTLKRTITWSGIESYKRLFRKVNGDISGALKEKDEDEDIYEDEQLTESEIKAWGYNPEMFDKEEVK